MMSNLKIMIKNYFLITIRSFWKNRATSIINIIGLSIGLSVVFLIYIYTSFEKSYDKYHENGDRIYRAAYHQKHQNGGEENSAMTGHNLASMLQNNFPETEKTARVAWIDNVKILNQNQNFEENKFLFADPSILKIFSFPMKQGDRETALNERKSIIISSRIAKKYFGDENPIGKLLGDNLQLKVTGIIDVPDNSHFRFDILASYSTIYDIFPYYRNQENELYDRNVYTYLMLNKGTSFINLEKKLPQFSQNYIEKGDYASIGLFLEPLERIHLYSTSKAILGEFSLSKFTLPIVVLFTILGFIIIGIACFNFINIAVAHITRRTKEVGVRKTYGARKSEIFFQFVFEYWLYSLIAVLLSIFIVQMFLPFISTLLNRQIKVNYLEYLIAASALLMLVTFFAGAYPSFVVARVSTVRALQSGFRGPKGNVLRSVLVVTQFSVSIILILITFYISRQINHYTTMDIGLDTRKLLVIRMDNEKIKKGYEMLKSELLKNPNILSVSASSNIPAVTGANRLTIKIDEMEEIPYQYISIDAGFTKNMGVNVVEGRGFSPDLESDVKSAFLLNRSAVKDLNIENPVGRNVILSVKQNDKSVQISSGPIVGVIDDYSYRANYDRSGGIIFNNDPNRYSAIFVRINSAKQKEVLNMLNDTWGNLFHDIPMTANFLEDEIKNEFFIQKLYGIQRFIKLAAVFSFILALLGLFGLSIFAAKQRIKEIGIRKVNGASIVKLLLLVNMKFLSMVLFSIMISFPVVYYLIEVIMSQTANSISLSVLNYTTAFAVIMLCTILTVSWQSWRAAKRNPVEALRYE